MRFKPGPHSSVFILSFSRKVDPQVHEALAMTNILLIFSLTDLLHLFPSLNPRGGAAYNGLFLPLYRGMILSGLGLGGTF